jgi:hypothetical protein
MIPTPARRKCSAHIRACAFSCAVAAAGCGSETSKSAHQAASTADAAPDGYVGCANDPRVSAFSIGLTAVSQDQAVHVSLVGAEPWPPIVGMNTWTVRIDDAADAATPDATLTVVPYMPDHAHGSPLPPMATSNGDGTYTIGQLYFFMPGVWRVAVTVSRSDAEPASTADFFLCVGG